MTKAMPFLQKVILLSYDPRPFVAGFFLALLWGPAQRGGADAPYKRFAHGAKPWRRRNSLPPSILIQRAPGPAPPGWVRKKYGLKAARRAPQFSKR